MADEVAVNVLGNGDDARIVFGLTQSGKPLDLAGLTLEFLIKDNSSDSDDDADTGTVTVTDSAGGLVSVSVDKDTVGNSDQSKWYKLKATDVHGFTTTAVYGPFNVRAV